MENVNKNPKPLTRKPVIFIRIFYRTNPIESMATNDLELPINCANSTN